MEGVMSKARLRLCVFTIVIFVSVAFYNKKVEAQTVNYFSLESGGGYGSGVIGKVDARYGRKISDSFSWELGGFWLSHDLKESPAGSLGGVGRIVYAFDMLSIVPSVWVGVGGGYDFNSQQPVFLLDYGIGADYLYSRRLKFGVFFGGITSQQLSSDENEEAEIASGWHISFRITWILGEEW
jgi:hypothetical protein